MKSFKVILSLVLACSIIFVPSFSEKTSNVTVSAATKYPTQWQLLPAYTHVKVKTIKKGSTRKVAEAAVVAGIATALATKRATKAALTKDGWKGVLEASVVAFAGGAFVEGKLTKSKYMYTKVTAKYRQIAKPQYDENGNIKNGYLEVRYTLTTYKDKALKNKVKSSTVTKKESRVPMW